MYNTKLIILPALGKQCAYLSLKEEKKLKVF